MAVAMVFTVVKVNDSKKVAKAGEGSTEVTTPYTDDSYLGTTFGTGIQNDYQTYLMLETMPERNIYVQNKKYSSFCLRFLTILIMCILMMKNLVLNNLE